MNFIHYEDQRKDENKFCYYCRMNYKTFGKLLHLLKSKVQHQDTNMRASTYISNREIGCHIKIKFSWIKMRLMIVITMLVVYSNCDEYYAKRARILDLGFKLNVGGNTTLNDKEVMVNNCLMKHKIKEIDYGMGHPDYYNVQYFSYKDKIADSKVYKIIKAMPKGAILHVHDLAILGEDYMLNITYMDNLYVCFGRKIKFIFSNTVPNTRCDDHWQLMSEVRKSAKNVTKFDMDIKNNFNVVVKNPDVAYPVSKDIWVKFRKYFGTVHGLLSYKPVWKQYIYDVLKSFKEDNIMYAEIRSSFLHINELNGTKYDNVTTAKIYIEVINKFMKENPDFFGAKIIVTSSRNITNIDIDSRIKNVQKMKRDLPELIIGFDLVGQEDMGKPLLDFVPVLKAVKDLHFFFHAGETNWYGTYIDENLIDAVLLGAKRIGHAYALTKHPLVMKEIIDRDIGIEVNVISNAVLSLVKDVRNHPLSIFLSHGLPVVLSSDDPGAWGADLLSEDFYVAFMGVASKHADLRMLKTLALNSLKYSALDSINKQKVIHAFYTKWNHFVNSFTCP